MKKHSLKYLLLLLLTCLCKQQYAQCPPLSNAKRFADTANVAEFLPLIVKYKDCPQEKDSLGYLYQKLAVAYYLNEELLEAIAAAEKAVETREQALSKNHTDIAYSLYSLGALNSKLDNDEQTEIAYKKAYQILLVSATTKEDKEKLVKTYLGLNKLRYKVGDYEKAMDFVEIALSDAKELGNEKLIANAYLDQSGILLAKKNYSLAIEKAANSVDLYQGLSKPAISNLASAHINLGIAYYELGDYKGALKNYEKALEYARKSKKTSKICFCYNNIGLVYKKMGKYAAANNYFNKILQDATLDCNRSAYNNLGDLLALQNGFQAANDFYEKAVLTIAGTAPTIDLEAIADTLSNIGNKEYLLTYLRDLARHQATATKYQENALALYHLLDKISDAMREEHYNPNSKLFWRDEVHPIYEEAIALALQLDKVETAFYFSEKSKAILLYDKVSENLLQVHLADSLQQQLNSSNLQIGYLEAKGKRSANEESRLLELKDEKGKLLANIKQLYPEYFRLKYETLNTKVEDALALLPDEKTVLIEFFYGKNVLYTFKIDKNNGLKAWTMPVDSQFRQDLTDFATLFREKGGRNLLYQPQEYGKLAYKLYQKLLPYEQLATFENLILIPDGYVNYLPFDALLREETEVNTFAELPYLGRRLAISYAYSLPILSLQKASKNQAAKQEVLAIFPEFTQGENGQAPLGNSQEELSGIQAKFANKTLRSAAANKHNFQNHAPDYQIIHLASHASGGTDSLAPSIEFIDSSFLLPSLFSLDLNCDLIVFSSCETGMGKYAAGEGVMSLARGFTYAGANSLVSTLWKVNDASTAKVMTHFYKHLAAGQPKAQALHLAKGDYLLDPDVADIQKSPYFWAGFVYVGNDTVVEAKKGIKWFWVLGVAFIFLISLIWRSQYHR